MDKPTDVFTATRDGSCCIQCRTPIKKGSFFVPQEQRSALCLKCAGLDHLALLPSGNAALTRRTGKYAPQTHPVLKWNRSRKKFIRQGILADEKAIEQARAECAADAEKREKRREKDALRREQLDEDYIRCFAEKIRQLYPHCPPDRELKIAEHACRKYSGRVGRSAKAKTLDEKSVRLAVTAHIRHAETDYDHLCEVTQSRALARAKVEDKINLMLRLWSA